MWLASSPRIGLVWLAPVFLLAVAPAAQAQLVYSDTLVALLGDTGPGTGMFGTYAGFSSFSVNAHGDTAFAASVSGGSASSGIFLSSGGSNSALALSGGVAPGTGGGFYSGVWEPSLNASGDVVFLAHVSAGTTTSGIFLDSGGTETLTKRIDRSLLLEEAERAARLRPKSYKSDLSLSALAAAPGLEEVQRNPVGLGHPEWELRSGALSSVYRG